MTPRRSAMTLRRWAPHRGQVPFPRQDEPFVAPARDPAGPPRHGRTSSSEPHPRNLILGTSSSEPHPRNLILGTSPSDPPPRNLPLRRSPSRPAPPALAPAASRSGGEPRARRRGARPSVGAAGA